MTRPLCFVTGNEHKLLEVQAMLGLPLQHVRLDLPEIQALDVDTVVRDKALRAHEHTGKTVLVEDTGLAFAAWNGLPGALIRWFLQTVGNHGLCRMLPNAGNRSAVARTAFALCDGGSVVVCGGEMRGTITLEPRGQQGFGWDAIFQPAGSNRTFAEMTSVEKNRLSMRRLAAAELRGWLREHWR
jgi:non-canonical purine NTP pyrophosphatase (RdgB/HAM1 family)